jgi:hypothetical protein
MEYAYTFGTKGVVSALDPLLLNQQSLSRATNMRLHRQLPRTRYKFREIPISGNTPLIDEWRTLPVQGAMFFNPAKGQGALDFGSDLSQIMEASGGRKFSLSIVGRGSNTKATLVERTEGITHDPYVHLTWWSQAENFALTCDGQSQLWVWDGRNPATASTGLNEVSKENSQLPNACTVILYVHYRIATVTDARRIYVGDGLHKTNLSSSTNLLNATEAVYWNSGQWFSPPSGMGNILAGGILPTRNTQHGHSEAVFHCEDGVFSVNLNIPRDQWGTSAISRHMLLKTGAVGPYALDLIDGDQVFRSRHGIQTLRSAAAETNSPLNPLSPISGEVADMLAADPPQFLRFTSLSNVPTFRRLFCSVYPVVALRRRWSKGFVVLNTNPTDVTPDAMRAWEGIWTLPHQWGGLVQFVTGIFAGVERVFALCWEPVEGRKTLIELTQMEGDDEIGDGTRSRISCQLWTRGIATRDLFAYKQASTGALLLKDVKGTLDYGVWYRGDGDGEWTKWRTGQVTVNDVNDSTLRGAGGRDFRVPLGDVPCPEREYRYIQFMVRWRGLATIESLNVKLNPAKEADDTGPVPTVEPQDGTLALCDYSDFEYTSTTRWEDSIYVDANQFC